MPATPTQRTPATGDSVRTAARWLAGSVIGYPTGALDVQAGPVRWSCWTTAEHIVDDLLAYALQLAGLPLLGYLPLVGPRGEEEIAHVDRSAGTAGLAEVLIASGELLATQVDARPPDVRAFHPYGVSDPAGFAAMGLVEVLVHGHDILIGLTGDRPRFPDGLAEIVLQRLFPDVPAGLPAPDADAALLWATGRQELPGHPRLARWRWDSSVL